MTAAALALLCAGVAGFAWWLDRPARLRRAMRRDFERETATQRTFLAGGWYRW